jgi:hypothetical protein
MSRAQNSCGTRVVPVSDAAAGGGKAAQPADAAPKASAGPYAAILRPTDAGGAILEDTMAQHVPLTLAAALLASTVAGASAQTLDMSVHDPFVLVALGVYFVLILVMLLAAILSTHERRGHRLSGHHSP